MFAYGQTGSGKSYSIAGKGSNKGMVPLVFETLFKQINEKKSSGDVQFEVFKTCFNYLHLKTIKCIMKGNFYND